LEDGISKYSGLLDMALESGFVTNPTKGWYQFGENKFRADNFGEHAEVLLASDEFKQWVIDKYSLNTRLWQAEEEEE